MARGGIKDAFKAAGNLISDCQRREFVVGRSTLVIIIMLLPLFFRLRQIFDAPSIADPAAATRATLAELPVGKFIRRGMTVAVGAGSRGISNYDVIVRTVCEELKQAGAEVFIVPAMGSHGGATDGGQLEVLAKYGITERTMGVPIRSSMEAVELGRSADFAVYQDRHAAAADAIV